MLSYFESLALMEEFVRRLSSSSASPPTSWGRSGNAPSLTWLTNEGVPSNRTGRIVFLDTAIVTKVFVANQNISNYTVEIFSHEGDEVNLTLLYTSPIVTTRYASFNTSLPVAKDKQLAMRIGSGSANNIVCGALVTGVT